MELGREVGDRVLDPYTPRCVRVSPESLQKEDREGKKKEVRLKEEKGLMPHEHFRVSLL